MYASVTFDVTWIKHKENPHIMYNSETKMFRCNTCDVLLNTNPGGAGKHSTKIHNITLSGKTVVKKKPVPVMEFSNQDIHEGLVDILTELEDKFDTVISHLETINNKSDEIRNQKYVLMQEISDVKLEQKNMVQKFNELKKENTRVVEFVRMYVIVKAAKDANLF